MPKIKGEMGFPGYGSKGGSEKITYLSEKKIGGGGEFDEKGVSIHATSNQILLKKNHERGFEKDESERCRSFNHSGSSLPRSTRQSEPYILAEPICPRLLDNAEPTSFPGGLITIAFTSVKSPQTISLLFSSSSDLNYDSSFVKEFLH